MSKPLLTGGRRLRRAVVAVLGLALALTVTNSPPASGAPATTVRTTQPVAAAAVPGVPTGFVQTQLAQGLKDPSVIAFAPTGDIYIGEQSGAILIYRNGSVLPTPVVTLNAFNQGETGLLGMAFDPNFRANGYLYVSYTVPYTSASGVAQQFTQLSRLTVVGGTASLASEKVYLRGNQVQNLHHAGNDLKVGPDGKLWWAVGDNVPSISNAQTLTNIYGKVLRFNLDGTIPADNPFVNVPGAVPSIYALGLRNPFRFTFLPDGRAMTEDTGSSFWEEMDVLRPGGNYGWPFYEGQCFGCGYLDPAYAYGHLPTDGAASAIAAYQGNTFPAQYRNTVFIGDYNRADIEAIQFDKTYGTELSQTVFDSNAGTIADLQEGPDGNLYFVSIFEGTFTEIAAAGPFPPRADASASPNTGLAPLPVQFSSAGSTDPYGLPLSYSWDFGDGSAPSTDPNPTHNYPTTGNYTAMLTVTGGTGGTQTATAPVPIIVGHAPPTAAINAPATYNAGDTLSFSGTASDPVDGTLPASAYSWQVDFITNGSAQPFYTSEAQHPFYGPVTGSTTGSVPLPADPAADPGGLFRITLTVTDTAGVATVVTRDVTPNPATWSAASNVPGTGYFVDGTLQNGPTTLSDRTGTAHILAGLPVQTVSGTRYRFRGWSDGSALTDSFVAGHDSTGHTATYSPVTSTLPGPWQSTDVGAPLMAGAADYAAADQTFYIDGSGSDIVGSKDQFHYVYQTLAGDGTVTARMRYQTNSDPWAKAGLMIKQTAQAGSSYVDALITPDVSSRTPNVNGTGCTVNGCLSPLPPVIPPTGNGVRMQYSGSKSVTAPTLTGYTSPNKWLRLQRTGTAFTSWESVDGQSWTKIGTTTLSMTGPVTIGMFVTSHDVGQYSTVAFDNVQLSTSSPVPPPWLDTDVGSPAIAGSASYSDGVFTVNGAGSDIWGATDQFHYVYQPVTGNGTIIARVTSQSNTGVNAKAGVMFKQSTAAGSAYLLIGTAPSGQVKEQYNFNGSTGGGTYAFPNVWMKLVMNAGKFTAYLSGDGNTWTQVLSKTLAITDPATVGLFTCSHNGTTIGTTTFDNVSFTPGP